MKHIFLALFAVLAYTSAMVYEPETQGYTASEVKGMSRLIERATKPHWRTHKAAVLAEVWGIQPDELETATRIWGGK